MKQFITTLLVLNTFLLQAAPADSTVRKEWFSVHAQATVISQTKPSFKVPYTGDNSLQPQKETQISMTGTLYLGAKLWKNASIYFNPEIAGGSGLSQALGIANAPNGETFRVGDPAPKVYVARLYMTQLFPLSKERQQQTSDFNQLAGAVPTKYISVTVGKTGIADFFDDNQYSHDPRTQFMSWGLMDNGAWDYPANTRGYIPTAVVEYVTPRNEIRYAMAAVPKTANGNNINWSIGKASSHMLEFTHRYKLPVGDGAVRLLGFITSANMGNYRQSINANPQAPDITATRQYGRTKYGLGINAEQALGNTFGCFARIGWNDGRNETWAFTEIDHSASLGLIANGSSWKRPNDHIGLAQVIGGISNEHKDYLAAGGKGFMLGDGQLNYSMEKMTELYYSADISKQHIYLSGAYQLLFNPGYNHDRKGPVNIFSLRIHCII